jgi:hypothetical protein
MQSRCNNGVTASRYSSIETRVRRRCEMSSAVVAAPEAEHARQNRPAQLSVGFQFRASSTRIPKVPSQRNGPRLRVPGNWQLVQLRRQEPSNAWPSEIATWNLSHRLKVGSPPGLSMNGRPTPVQSTRHQKSAHRPILILRRSSVHVKYPLGMGVLIAKNAACACIDDDQLDSC